MGRNGTPKARGNGTQENPTRLERSSKMTPDGHPGRLAVRRGAELGDVAVGEGQEDVAFGGDDPGLQSEGRSTKIGATPM